MKITLALIAAVGLAVPASAMPSDAEPYKVLVSYADLNLESPEGLAQLDRRIDNAAREACGYDRVVTGTRIPLPGTRTCMETAKAKAKARVAAIIEAQARGG